MEERLEMHRSGVRVPPGYGALLDRALEVFSADQRVRAAWVHGSLARGDGDALSDLDVIVAVDDTALDEFGAGWRERLAEITPTVMARRFFGPGGSWLAITPTCQRFDLWVEAASEVAASVVRDRIRLFDRDGLDGSVPAPDPPALPLAAKFDQLRDWYASCAAVLNVESEPLLRIEAVHTLRWILYEAYVETNRPLPVTGLKQWSAKLGDAQRRTLEALLPRGGVEPVVAALDDVLGSPSPPLPPPDLARVVFPPEGLIRGVALLAESPPARARHIAEEFLAMHLYLTIVLHREDWLLGQDGVSLLRKLLYELDLEENGRRVAAGPADWAGRLTTEQHDELLELPLGAATPDAVIDGHLAVRRAFVRRGRTLLGDEWPAELELAVCRHVDEHVERYWERVAARP
jgi:hypothetical protein